MANEKFRLAGERNFARGRFNAGRLALRQLHTQWQPLRYDDRFIIDDELYKAIKHLNHEKYQLQLLTSQLDPLLSEVEDRLGYLQKLDKQLNTLIRNKRKGK